MICIEQELRDILIATAYTSRGKGREHPTREFARHILAALRTFNHLEYRDAKTIARRVETARAGEAGS